MEYSEAWITASAQTDRLVGIVPFVVVRFAERIHVLHAFEKKSQKTRGREIDLARRRYRQLISEERAR